MDATTGGPMVRFGTKWPSITSRCSMEAPPRSAEAISRSRRAKSADRIDGTISTICGLLRFYHSGEETVPALAPRKAPQGFRHQVRGHLPQGLFILLGFQRTGGVDQQPAGGQHGA